MQTDISVGEGQCPSRNLPNTDLPVCCTGAAAPKAPLCKGCARRRVSERNRPKGGS